MTVRGAAVVGAGLRPARPSRPIVPGERIHILGVYGAGASAAALLASWTGAVVDGCDPGGPSQYAPALEAEGIPVAARHDPAHLVAGRPPSRLAVTKALTAVDPDNAELQAARDARIPLEPWQQVVADAAHGRLLIAVAGTHGKSTTSGWLVHVLAHAGADPGAFVGALLPPQLTGLGMAATARRGEGRPFVVEADEYAGNFDPYRPAIAIVTSVEWDHPDVFADRDAVIASFQAWLRQAAAAQTPEAPLRIVANVGDDGVLELVRRLADCPARLVAVALADEAPGAGDLDGDPPRAPGGAVARWVTARITDAAPDATAIEVRVDGGEPRSVRLASAGRHNVRNALCVLGAALLVDGVDEARALEGLASFSGVGRRLERKGEAAGAVVYDDYGHHPTAIRETLAAVRQREPGRRVWAVYEPLTYHRTAALLDEFADVLATADAVAVADIWAGRDLDTTVASAAQLAAAVAERNPGIPVAAPGSVEATAAWLAGRVRAGDAVLVMGGGRSYRIGELLLEALRA